MNILKVWGVVKNFLPTKKISGWILGVIAAGLAVVMGVSGDDLKERFCAADPIELPKITVEKPEEKPEASEVKQEEL
jgi:hypothetical protein